MVLGLRGPAFTANSSKVRQTEECRREIRAKIRKERQIRVRETGRKSISKRMKGIMRKKERELLKALLFCCRRSNVLSAVGEKT